jgi:hypothetical protein
MIQVCCLRSLVDFVLIEIAFVEGFNDLLPQNVMTLQRWPGFAGLADTVPSTLHYKIDSEPIVDPIFGDEITDHFLVSSHLRLHS